MPLQPAGNLDTWTDPVSVGVASAHIGNARAAEVDADVFDK